MAYDETLADRIRKVLAGDDRVTERKMFGGIAFMLNGNMACGIVKNELMARVGADAYDDALPKPHARPMQFTGSPMKRHGQRCARRDCRQKPKDRDRPLPALRRIACAQARTGIS